MSETIFGLPMSAALMWGAGILNFIGIAIVWRSWKEDKNELMTAFMAFLASMGVAQIFIGLADYLSITELSYIGGLAILIGSIIMLKFPLLSFPQSIRRTVFYIAILMSVTFFMWVMFSPVGKASMFSFIMWYMIIVNGFIVSFFIFFAGMMAKERWFKVKATGGGLGIASCCVFSHAAAMSGAFIASAILQMLAPVIIVGSILMGRYYQKQTQIDIDSTSVN